MILSTKIHNILGLFSKIQTASHRKMIFLNMNSACNKCIPCVRMLSFCQKPTSIGQITPFKNRCPTTEGIPIVTQDKSHPAVTNLTTLSTNLVALAPSSPVMQLEVSIQANVMNNLEDGACFIWTSQTHPFCPSFPVIKSARTQSRLQVQKLPFPNNGLYCTTLVFFIHIQEDNSSKIWTNYCTNWQHLETVLFLQETSMNQSETIMKDSTVFSSSTILLTLSHTVTDPMIMSWPT